MKRIARVHPTVVYPLSEMCDNGRDLFQIWCRVKSTTIRVINTGKSSQTFCIYNITSKYVLLFHSRVIMYLKDDKKLTYHVCDSICFILSCFSSLSIHPRKALQISLECIPHFIDHFLSLSRFDDCKKRNEQFVK